MPTKRCTKCGRDLPATTDYFYRCPTWKDGLTYRCRPCINDDCRLWRERYPPAQRAAKRAERERILAEHPGCKICSKCGGVFPATTDNFYARKGAPDGLRADCKRCFLDACTQRQRAHPQKRKSQQQAHYQKNRQAILASCRTYRIEHREKILAYLRQWRQEHLEEARAYDRLRNKARAHRYTSSVRHRARKKSLLVTLTEADWLFCLDYWHHACAICGATAGLWHNIAADHWIPLASRRCPGTTPDNILPLCNGRYGCNTIKGDREPEAWLKERLGEKKARKKLQEIAGYFALVRKRTC